jgi:hypothetical protein
MPDGTTVSFGQRSRTNAVPRLPDQLSVNFGPAEAIGRVVLATDFAVRQAGIRLSLSTDFEELAHVNAANQRDWYPLMPNFDPRHSTLTAENAFWLKGINAQGEVVLCQAVRLYAFGGTTLKDELESLRFYYERPEAAIANGISIKVAAPIASTISRRVSYGGALWIRSDFRGGGLARLIPAVNRALAVTRWYPSYHTCILMQPTVEKGMAKVYGYDHLEYAIWVKNLPGFTTDLKSAVCWKTTDEAVREIEERASGGLLSKRPAETRSVAAREEALVNA